jgi:large subunit ribosomal protein L5
MSRMKQKYLEEVRPALVKRFTYKNVMQAPRIEKVVINMGLGEGKENPKILDAAVNDLSIITGQKPIITRARRSVASFKVREGMPIGCKLTLRGVRMYDFLDKFFNIALPRVRDFRGISPHSFDGRGNFTIGIKEQLIFPEIEYSQVERVLGMDITIVTTAETDEEARELLTMMGMPFKAA